MKTIIVIYTNRKITSKKEIASHKAYAFNTEDEVKVGDMISSSTYDTSFQVVKVLSKKYKYYNKSTGQLSNTYSSTLQWEVRQLVMLPSIEDAIFGSFVKEPF